MPSWVGNLQGLSFRLVRQGNHAAMVRENADGTKTPPTIPSHPTIEPQTLRTILTQAGIPGDELLGVYEES